MAYKFQVGAAILSGSITHKQSAVFSSGLSNADQNITNVGDIAVDSLSADGNEIDIILTDNIENALEIKEGSNTYMKFDTRNSGGENIALLKPVDFSNQASTNMNIDSGDIASSVTINKSPAVNFNSGDVQGSITLTELASGTGALTIQANAVEGSMLNDNVISGQTELASGLALTDELMVSDAGTLKRMDISLLAEAIDGAGISNNSGLLDIDAAQTGIESIYNAALIVGRGASDAHIDFSTDNQIQFDIDNTATMNLSANGINVQQGGIQVPAGQDVDVAGAGAASLYASVGANNLTLGGASSTVVIPGNLTVSGTTVEVDAAFVVTSSIQFEGATPDGNEITLTSADPSADRTITLPDLSGHVPLLAGAVSNANVLAAEFALLDGGSSIGTDGLADGDGFLHNDGGTMKQTQMVKIAEYVLPKIVGGDVEVDSAGDAVIQASAVEASMLNNNIVSGLTDIGAAIADTDEMIISDAGTIRRMDMSRLKTYIGSGVAEVTEFGDGDATLAVGLNVANANTSTARTLTLPASSGLSAGQSVRVKVAGVSSGAVTIARAGSQTIDGNLTSVVLESDNAAIELVYVGTDDWRIF